MDGKTRAALARNVRTLRAWHKLSQAELGAKADLAQTLISYLEQPDGKSPTLSTIEAVAAALRVPAWALLLPDLPTEPAVTRNLDRLATTYLHVGTDGRETLDKIAESEARYYAGRDA